MGIFKIYSQLFSSRVFSVCVVLLALINKSWLCYLHFSLVGDKSIFSLMASNAVNGKGFTETYYFLEHPAQQFLFTNPAFNSPGYSILLSIPLWLTRDLFLSCLIIDAAGWFLLITGMRALLKQAGATLTTINLVTLLIGFYIYPHEFVSSPKDTLSVSLLCWALFFLIRSINNPNPTIKSGFLPGLFFILPGLVKLSYLPFAIIFPLIILFLNFYKKKKSIWKIFWGSYLSVFITYFIVYGLLRLTNRAFPDELTSSIVNSWQIEKGPHEFGITLLNISKMYPFVPASIINTDLTGLVLVGKWKLPLPNVVGVFILTNFSLILFLLVFFGRYLLKYLKAEKDRSTMLIMSGGLISITLFFMLSALAIFLLPVYYKGSETPYTYVLEGRAYLFIIVFLQLAFFIRLWNQRYQLSSFWKLTTSILFTALLLNAVYGFYYSVKNAFSDVKKETFHAGPAYQPILNQINTIKKDNPGREISLVTNISHLRWLLLLNGEKVNSDAGTLWKKNIPLATNELRILVLYEEDLPVFNDYINREDVTKLYKHGQFVIVEEGFPYK